MSDDRMDTKTTPIVQRQRRVLQPGESHEVPVWVDLPKTRIRFMDPHDGLVNSLDWYHYGYLMQLVFGVDASGEYEFTIKRKG